MEITHEPHAIDPEVYRRRWAILAVLCASLLIVIIGNTSLNVAIPTLGRDLNASTSAIQWMIDAYSLIFAGLLFTAATIGDRFGRKGALQTGLLVFLVGAAVAATADTSNMVIIARGIMGIAAAFVMPSTLSILANVFPANERPNAINTTIPAFGATHQKPGGIQFIKPLFVFQKPTVAIIAIFAVTEIATLFIPGINRICAV